MPKKKKTRKEKMVTDQRREVQQTPLYSVPDVVVTTKIPSIPTPSHVSKPIAISTTDYHYLAKDLIKTGIFTGAVVVLELALYFILNKGV
jgi:hypothetical protein